MKLTKIEKEIAKLVAKGHTNKEIALRVHLSLQGVKWNLAKIYKKAGVKNKIQLAALYAALEALRE